MTLSRISLAALLIAMPGMSLAHATWIAERSGAYAVVRGEGSATDEAYDPAKVLTPLGFDAAGAPLAATLTALEAAVHFAPAVGIAVLSATYDEGWWTEDAAGEWHNASAETFPDFKGTGHYITYPVAYVAATTVQNPVGHPVEIVPLTDPTVLSMGDKLEVQVLLDGAPVVGVAVTNDVLTDWDISSTLTDADGKAFVTVANNGLNVLQYYHEVQVSDKEVAGHQAVLSFVAGGPADAED